MLQGHGQPRMASLVSLEAAGIEARQLPPAPVKAFGRSRGAEDERAAEHWQIARRMEHEDPHRLRKLGLSHFKMSRRA